MGKHVFPHLICSIWSGSGSDSYWLFLIQTLSFSLLFVCFLMSCLLCVDAQRDCHREMTYLIGDAAVKRTQRGTHFLSFYLLSALEAAASEKLTRRN